MTSSDKKYTSVLLIYFPVFQMKDLIMLFSHVKQTFPETTAEISHYLKTNQTSLSTFFPNETENPPKTGL